ncbi:MAG: DegV family protein [Agarilytica sp.]
MASNIAVITDSSCSLPTSVLKKYQINQVPLEISIDGGSLRDPCNESKTLAMFNSGQLSKKHSVSTSPPTPEDFENAITRALNSGKKMIVVQTVNRTQGETYNNANVAASSVRRKLGDKHKDVAIRVMDCRTVFAGQGLMVAETIRRMLKGQDPAGVRREMDNLSENIHTFILPREPLLALERSQKRNEKAVGWAQVFIANTLGIHPILCNVNDSSYLAAKSFGFEKAAKQLFNHAQKQIEKGLLCPLLSVNYAGSLHELKSLPGYNELKATADAHKIQIIPSVMSLAGGIYTSVGSISLAFACEPHEWMGKAKAA